MADLGDFTPDCSPTQLIIPKSMHQILLTLQSTYPITSHRILLACIRDKGLCPCPRCLVLKSDIHRLGQATDFTSRVKKAHTYIGDTIRHLRNSIYKGGFGVTSAGVERALKPESWTPTLVRVFCLWLRCELITGLEHFCRDPWWTGIQSLCEAGCWLATWVWIGSLEGGIQTSCTSFVCCSSSWTPCHRAGPPVRGVFFNMLIIMPFLIHIIRFCQMPTFGHSTIRRFCTNTSEMKKLAARNYEDILQVCNTGIIEPNLTELPSRSVLYLRSRDCYLSPITPLWPSYIFVLLNGMR